MRIAAVYDSDGRILGAAPADDDYDGPVPVAPEGAQMEVMDVPDSVRDRGLHEICTSLRVDVAAKQLTDA